jgi:hypothetical protein
MCQSEHLLLAEIHIRLSFTSTPTDVGLNLWSLHKHTHTHTPSFLERAQSLMWKIFNTASYIFKCGSIHPLPHTPLWRSVTFYVFNDLNNTVEHSTSWDAASFSATQEIPLLLQNPNVKNINVNSDLYLGLNYKSITNIWCFLNTSLSGLFM